MRVGTKLWIPCLAAIALLFAASPGTAQGIFDKTADWDRNDGTKAEGSAEFADGVYTLRGNGNDIWDNVDEGFFLYTERAGSWRLQARVQWVDPGPDPWAKIGVMIRATGDKADSRHSWGAIRGANDRTDAQYRSVDGMSSRNTEFLNHDTLSAANPASSNGMWIRVSRWAPLNLIWVEWSHDGSNWFHGYTNFVDYPETVAYGLAITNHLANLDLAVGIADNVELVELTVLPEGVLDGPVGAFDQSVNLGAHNLKGEATYANGVYTITGIGPDIWNQTDRMYYVYNEMSGAFMIESGDWFNVEPSTSGWNKGGLMIRDHLGAQSPNVFAMLRQDIQFRSQVRASNYAATTGGSLIPVGTHSERYRMVRIGSMVEVYYLSGSDWVLENRAVIQLEDPIYVGFAVTSNTNNQFSTFEFGDVTITEYPFEVNRSIGTTTFSLGQEIPVDLRISIREGATAANLTITETVPAGLAVYGITGGGTLSGNVITWNLGDVASSTSVGYKVGAPQSLDIFKIDWGTASATASGITLGVGGPNSLEARVFHYIETFSYPTQEAGAAIDGLNGGFRGYASGRGAAPGWGSEAWSVPAGRNVTLDGQRVDAGLIQSQDPAFNPGNFSAKLTGNVGDGGLGLARKIDPVDGGELWLSFTFFDEGPASQHYAGISLHDVNGQEVAFVGKPWNSSTAGLGNLPGDDQLTDVDYTVPNHYLVRYVIRSNDSQVYLWMNPDKDDRLDTYDASGPDQIPNIAELRLRRGGGTGSGFYDNIWISSIPALPKAGAARIDLQLLDVTDGERDPSLPAWDSISVDQIDDNITGQPGFGHDNGNNHYLVVAGHIYYSNFPTPMTNQVVAFGLPFDRISGLNGHMLGHFNNPGAGDNFKNAIKLQKNDQQRGPFRFDVEPGNYTEIRSIQTVGNGDGRLLATFHYEDGSTSEGFFAADDWFNNPPALDFPRAFLIIDGMNRLGGDGNFDGRYDPAVFEDAQPVDPERVLVSVELVVDEGFGGNFAYNLFHMLANPVVDIVSVNDWALF